MDKSEVVEMLDKPAKIDEEDKNEQSCKSPALGEDEKVTDNRSLSDKSSNKGIDACKKIASQIIFSITKSHEQGTDDVNNIVTDAHSYGTPNRIHTTDIYAEEQKDSAVKRKHYLAYNEIACAQIYRVSASGEGDIDPEYTKLRINRKVDLPSFATYLKLEDKHSKEIHIEVIEKEDVLVDFTKHMPSKLDKWGENCDKNSRSDDIPASDDEGDEIPLAEYQFTARDRVDDSLVFPSGVPGVVQATAQENENDQSNEDDSEDGDSEDGDSVGEPEDSGSGGSLQPEITDAHMHPLLQTPATSVECLESACEDERHGELVGTVQTPTPTDYVYMTQASELVRKPTIDLIVVTPGTQPKADTSTGSETLPHSKHSLLTNNGTTVEVSSDNVMTNLAVLSVALSFPLLEMSTAPEQPPSEQTSTNDDGDNNNNDKVQQAQDTTWLSSFPSVHMLSPTTNDDSILQLPLSEQAICLPEDTVMESQDEEETCEPVDTQLEDSDQTSQSSPFVSSPDGSVVDDEEEEFSLEKHRWLNCALF